MPILAGKFHGEPSAFTPESLLREARRQKETPRIPVPETCLLDPDGDMVRFLRTEGPLSKAEGWACYHTVLFVFELDGSSVGVIGGAVGAPFAVLVAEELFASGCRQLISITSSGRLVPVREPPYFVLIERALRDEGTSYYYLPPSEYSEAPASLLRVAQDALQGLAIPVLVGGTWTTDAPFRETEQAIASMRVRGLLAVEMEAAALYAFAAARSRPVLCFAHVTNQMGMKVGDFEKGAGNGATDGLALVSRTARMFGDSANRP